MILKVDTLLCVQPLFTKVYKQLAISWVAFGVLPKLEGQMAKMAAGVFTKFNRLFNVCRQSH